MYGIGMGHRSAFVWLPSIPEAVCWEGRIPTSVHLIQSQANGDLTLAD